MIAKKGVERGIAKPSDFMGLGNAKKGRRKTMALGLAFFGVKMRGIQRDLELEEGETSGLRPENV